MEVATSSAKARSVDVAFCFFYVVPSPHDRVRMPLLARGAHRQSARSAWKGRSAADPRASIPTVPARVQSHGCLKDARAPHARGPLVARGAHLAQHVGLLQRRHGLPALHTRGALRPFANLVAASTDSFHRGAPGAAGVHQQMWMRRERLRWRRPASWIHAREDHVLFCEYNAAVSGMVAVSSAPVPHASRPRISHACF